MVEGEVCSREAITSLIILIWRVCLLQYPNVRYPTGAAASGPSSGSASSTKASDGTHHTPRKHPDHWGAPSTRCCPGLHDAAMQPPHVVESWGSPGEPDEKQALAGGLAEYPLCTDVWKGKLRGETEQGSVPEVWYHQERLQTPFSGSQMTIYRFQRETRSAVSACRIKWVN